MICPECQASHPDGTGVCSRCGHSLADPNRTLRLEDVAASEMPTLASPASLKEWARTHPPAAPISVVLPEGLEIGSRYRVRKLLGIGGMGAVYSVHDGELDRDVALKLIRSDISTNPVALERFKREIQLSSRVTHRNVLRVYDLGEADGIKFLTMQLVEGEDLAAVLNREKRLSVPRLLSILGQILEGLEAAHQQGVIHRDLKPQNIMIDRADNVFLTDFGLAKSLEQSGMTHTGAIVGTPYYMSPEQVRGAPVDHRCDIYALGVIVYEMATGELPFTGSTPYEVMAQRLLKQPRPAGELAPELPGFLRKVLERCMATDPSVRYGSVREIRQDLESARFRTTLRFEARRRPRLVRAIATAAAAALLAAGVFWITRRTGTRPTSSTPTAPAAQVVLGVLPFENRTGDPSLDWYGEGIARLVADSLAQSRHLRVVSTDQLLTMRRVHPGRAALLRAAAAEGIAHLLTGDLLRGPTGISVSTRLSRTKDGHELSAGRIDRLSPSALIGASDRIALVAKKGLGLPPTEGVDAYGADFVSRNPDAYESYVAGLHAVNDYRYRDAESNFATALKKAPDYAMARYWLATVKAASGRTEEALSDIRQVVAQASHLPDREARYVRAAEAYFSRRYDDALKEYRELIARYPYEVEARRIAVNVLLDTNRPKEAVAEAQALAKVAPESHVVWSLLGTARLTEKDFNQAVLDLKRYVELEPGSANGHHLLGDSYRCQGEFDLAAGEYEKALEADPDFHFATIALATVDSLRGRSEDAARRLEALVQDAKALPVHRIDAAFGLAALDRARGRFRDAARILESLEKPIAEEKIRAAQALSERGVSLVELGRFPEASRLLALAVERAPGAPTRYLFARGLLELAEGRLEEVRKTAAKIMESALPRGDPDRTEEKASAYLTGMALLAERQSDAAVSDLSRAVSLSGYEYRIYRVGLANAYREGGKINEALAAAKQASAPLDPVDPRLDFELDRVRALLVLAESQKALGRPKEAAAEAAHFLELWRDADAGLPDLARARALAAEGR